MFRCSRRKTRNPYVITGFLYGKARGAACAFAKRIAGHCEAASGPDTARAYYNIHRTGIAAALLLILTGAIASAGENLIVNGDFDRDTHGWSDLWTRTPSGKLTLDRQEKHGGSQAVRIEHTGREDWSFQQHRTLDVQPGQIFELSGWARVEGQGSAVLCVTLRDRRGKAIDWSFGAQTARATGGWKALRGRFVVPADAAQMTARLIGYGPATVWFADARLEAQGSIATMRGKAIPPSVKITSALLEVTLDTADAAMTIVDRRSGHRWTQRPRQPAIVLDARPTPGGFDLVLLEPAQMLRMTAAVRLDDTRPELTVELSATGPLSGFVEFPHPLATDKDTLLILPVNEGICYPAADATLHATEYHLYGGHGLCMGWYGQTDGRRAALVIVETPDDARVSMPRQNGLLSLVPRWESQRGQFGPARRLRYVFFDDGGYVAMAKRYRQFAKETGLLKTLAEKRQANPNVDLLVGAVNVWCWDRDAVAICRELQAAGIGRILWSNRAEPETLRQLNAMEGVLTSRYDIYQDVMNPAEFPKLSWIHPDWTTAGWPKDIMLDAEGRWIHGWEVETKDGRRIPCGTLCDRQAVSYARDRISAELKTHPYRCRFIDTTTASPWRECYHPDHPMTRTESRHWKMELLRYVGEGSKLVAGSETGHEAAVPFVHYFEGMMSLGPYRVADAGRNMGRILDEVPPQVAKFQTGHFYRLPLWELVYHDCVVAQWYWGDYNNKLPRVWDRRDLWNALYGTPPMFMFHRKVWQENRDRFVRSYQTAATVARQTGYVEMLSHAWLTPDHAVQRTTFANGVEVTVNFGEENYEMADGKKLEGKGYEIRNTKNH